MNKFARPSQVFLVVALISPLLLVAQIPQKIGDVAPRVNGPDVGRNRVQVRNSDGNKTVNVKEGNRDIEIIRRADGHVFVNITKHYGPDDLDSLIRREPDLEPHIASFPTKSGDSVVQLSIGITTRHEAANEDKLKAKNNVAYGLYKRYIRQAGQSSPRIRSGIGTRQIGPALPGRKGTDFKQNDGPEEPQKHESASYE